jgi:hypothetical protein
MFLIFFFFFFISPFSRINNFGICDESCDDNYYNDGGSCDSCTDTNCEVCDPGDICTQCKENWYLDSSSDCVASCTGSYFENSDTWVCDPCDTTCLTCDGESSSDCLTCDEAGRYIFNILICKIKLKKNLK